MQAYQESFTPSFARQGLSIAKDGVKDFWTVCMSAGGDQASYNTG